MKIDVSKTKQQLGARAADHGAALIRAAIRRRGWANIIVATGASQFETLERLVAAEGIAWNKVTAFHLDEYVGIPITHPASFRLYLWRRFVSRLPLPLAGFHYVNGEDDPAAECKRLAAVIRKHPIDVAFVGIGENGHLAFNDPPADFRTNAAYLVVNLDEACRRQQMGEGWFKTLKDVPRRAISMSIRQIMRSGAIICAVPDARKAPAVHACLDGPVSPEAPASILQRHADAAIFLDRASAGLLETQAMSHGFYDLQVNGYGGADFNSDNLAAEPLHAACAMLRFHGVDHILATVITDDVTTMAARLATLMRHRERDPLVKEVIAGFHIEGPFINETTGFRGAHAVRFIRPADADAMRRLLDAAGGLTRLVTLAPERDPGLAVTKLLAQQGIVVSAGHSDASFDDLHGALDAGLTMFTHLGNGCPMQTHRHDNIIQRALSLSDRLWLCFIADGVHVPYFMLKTCLRAAGLERCVVVTDAIAAAGLGPGRYTLGYWTVQVGDDLAARAPDGSHFVGSAVTMPRSIENLVAGVGLTAEQARQLTCDHPRQALQLKPT